MTVSFWQRSVGAPREESFDVCIVGAGIAGAAVAWWLRRVSPQLSVCLIEKGNAASGASGRNAGMVLAGLAGHYDDMIRIYGHAAAREIWQTTLDHRRWLGEFLEESKADVQLDSCGSWRVGLEEAERVHLERSAKLLKADGFPVEFRADDPLGRGFYGALGIREDCGVHPLMLVRALIANSGAVLYEDAEVFDISAERGEILIRSTNHKIRAGRTVIALNAYAGLLDQRWRQLVTPHRGQILVTAPLSTRILDQLVYAHHGYIYFRQLPDARLLVGGWRHEYAETEAGYEDMTTPDIQGKLEGFMRHRFPEAAEAPIAARWAGTMGFSIDGLPFADCLADESQIYYLLGFTGHGFGLALEVARRLVLLMLRGEPTGVFAISRLGNDPTSDSPQPTHS